MVSNRSIRRVLIVLGLLAAVHPARAVTTFGNDAAGGNTATTAELSWSWGTDGYFESDPNLPNGNTVHSLSFGVSGTLRIDSTLTVSGGSITFSGYSGTNNSFMIAGGTLTTGGSSALALRMSAPSPVVIASSISGSGGLTFDGGYPTSLILAGSNTYTGTTTIATGPGLEGALCFGVDNATGSGPLVLSTASLVLGSYSARVASFTMAGQGDLVIAANKTATPQLSCTGALNFACNNSFLILTGMGNTAGLYKIAAGSSLTGYAPNVSGLDPNYLFCFGTLNPNELDAQHKGTIDLRLSGSSVVHTGNQSVTVTVQNTAPAGSAALSCTGSGVVAGPLYILPGGGSPLGGSYVATAGTNTVTETFVDPNATTSSTTATLTQVAYRLAAPNPISGVNLGYVHVGGTFGNRVLTVTNTAANDGFSEKLDAGFGGITGAASASGSAALLGPQSSDTTSLVVGLGGAARTGTAGVVSGTAVVTLTSDGNGTSGLGVTALASRNVAVTGGVFSGKAQWNVATGGSWSPDTNWKDTQSATLGGAPGLFGAAGDTALFGGVPTSGSAIITLDSSPRVASVTFSNSNASYVLMPGSGGPLVLDNGGNSAAITGSAGTHFVNAPVTLASDLLAAVNSGTLSVGSIFESGSPKMLQKSGAGTLILTGSNTYSGATTVSNGTLALGPAGSIANSGTIAILPGATLDVSAENGWFTVSTAQTLKGNGTVRGAAMINGNLSLGASPGTFTFANGNLTLSGTTTLQLQGTVAGTTYDQISLNGGNCTLSLGGILNPQFSGYTPTGYDVLWVFLNNTLGSTTGIFSGMPDNATFATYGGFDWKITYEADSATSALSGGNDVAIFSVPAPEPDACGIVLTGMGMLFNMRRLRRKSTGRLHKASV